MVHWSYSGDRWWQGLPILFLMMLAFGCAGSSPADDGAPKNTDDTSPSMPGMASYSDLKTVVPSSAMPTEVKSMMAHNNLDIIRFKERLFFAFRTAPDHFASPKTMLYVVSTADEETWRFEGAFNEGRDLREPRFLVIGDRLILFYARLGVERTAFEPGVARRAIYQAPGQWTPSEDVFGGGFIPWRIVMKDGTAYLMGYIENGSIYSGKESNSLVQWFKSDDGDVWTPVTPNGPTMMVGGVSETAFAFMANGDLVTVGRNEAGDKGGFGSRICHAPADDLYAWRCKDAPKKYDSPLVFRHGNQAYLIGRRHLTEDGHYDQSDADDDLVAQRLSNLAAYWNVAKRCALWRVDPKALTVEWVLDFPTAGDTCFASIVPHGANQYLMYDYRSVTDDPDIGWVIGQRGPTEIYRAVLSLP